MQEVLERRGVVPVLVAKMEEFFEYCASQITNALAESESGEVYGAIFSNSCQFGCYVNTDDGVGGYVIAGLIEESIGSLEHVLFKPIRSPLGDEAIIQAFIAEVLDDGAVEGMGLLLQSPLGSGFEF